MHRFGEVKGREGKNHDGEVLHLEACRGSMGDEICPMVKGFDAVLSDDHGAV